MDKPSIRDIVTYLFLVALTAGLIVIVGAMHVISESHPNYPRAGVLTGIAGVNMLLAIAIRPK